MSLSLRTIKISLSAFIAILLSNLIGLDYAVSAGIIAILSVLDTNKSSLLTAGKRVLSTILALTIAAIVFSILGFEIYVFTLYLLIYVPLAYLLGVESGIAPCSVLVTHLLIEESISLPWITNELLLMLVGAGIAILINLYMPSQSDRIIKMREEADECMREVLLSFSKTLNEGAPINSSLLTKLELLLTEAEKLIFLESENRFLNQSEYDIKYIEMRKNQTTVLKYMRQNLEICVIPMKENKILASLFYLTSDQLHENNTGEFLLKDIQLLLNQFRKSSLPQTRFEFENRAILFQLLNDFTRFIQTKKDFFDQNHSLS